MEESHTIDPRLVSMGMFASSVAHEINTPLFYLEGNLDFIQRDLAEGSALGEEKLADIRRMVDDALHGARTLRSIVNDLKVFTRPTSKDPERVALSEVFELASRLAGRELREESVKLRLQEEDLPDVLGWPGVLGMLVGNFILNAHQAEATDITVTAAREGRHVAVAVSDNGNGIKAEDMPHIFEPFFTTRAETGGTGIGLALCKSLADLLGANIRVESKKGEGATMYLDLKPAE